MSDSHVWLQHLSSSLAASRQAAYLYQVESGTVDFLGDVMGIFGVATDEMPRGKQGFTDFIYADDLIARQLQISDIISKCTSSEKSFKLYYRIQRQDGTIIPVIETGVARYSPHDVKTTLQGLVSLDVQAIERVKKLTRKMGLQETVQNVFSGNKTRQDFIDKIDFVLSMDDRNDKSGFVMMVGVDRLHLVNEVYGSQFADEMLEKIESILVKLLNGIGEVSRVSGDTFALLFSNQAHGLMADTAQNILRVFYNQPIEVQSRFVHQIVSIGGMRIFDKETLSGSKILSRAELALQDAKVRGRGCFIEYSERLGEEVNDFRNVLSIGDSFLKNYRDGRVKIAFQGVINTRTNDVSFYECLIRMVDENGEVHSAGQFIDAVEKMGLTRMVDTFATQAAIRELKEFPLICLSVNVSNHTLTDPDWLKAVTMELRDFPEIAMRLIVEITESVAMSDINQTLRVVRALQGLGCRVALDDFGVGQTAFSHLKDLSLDIVKIDKSFVREMGREENKLFIRTLHSLASSMNLETVAEGAETMAESDLLIKDGIDHIQGFVNGLPSMDRLWLKT